MVPVNETALCRTSRKHDCDCSDLRTKRLELIVVWCQRNVAPLGGGESRISVIVCVVTGPMRLT
jgi:hypothetical protein